MKKDKCSLMFKTLLIFASLTFASLFLVSCKNEIPNPIIGTYTLRADGSTEDTAAISLRKDGSFVFIQVIPKTREIIKLEGTYNYNLRAFNFVSADGSITFKVSTPIPTGVQNTFLKEGSNYFLFDWKCDKDTGPKSLSLVINPNDSYTIYEFIYSSKESL